MSTYVQISLEDMKHFLEERGFKQIPLPGTVEAVYAKRVYHNEDSRIQLSLRVYTGISGGVSREKGKDAIRCAVFWRNAEGVIKMVGGSKRVHRVEGWRKNLESRLNDVKSMMPEHICDRCKSPMVKRKGAHGEFFGCLNYPNCKNTRQ